MYFQHESVQVVVEEVPSREAQTLSKSVLDRLLAATPQHSEFVNIVPDELDLLNDIDAPL